MLFVIENDSESYHWYLAVYKASFTVIIPHELPSQWIEVYKIHIFNTSTCYEIESPFEIFLFFFVRKRAVGGGVGMGVNADWAVKSTHLLIHSTSRFEDKLRHHRYAEESHDLMRKMSMEIFNALV